MWLSRRFFTAKNIFSINLISVLSHFCEKFRKHETIELTGILNLRHYPIIRKKTFVNPQEEEKNEERKIESCSREDAYNVMKKYVLKEPLKYFMTNKTLTTLSMIWIEDILTLIDS
ncbi:CLUMA_CG011815, isoform A [Clunio marinus]|uniref:CLUMA_CG011815, isoform A n=1 Tax=Clunio marinus TaxID=568069 RepID=A0A1J1IFD1_9DIPT|nr:CLUMA_CG011815, isoform A [Clunio marinus]